MHNWVLLLHGDEANLPADGDDGQKHQSVPIPSVKLIRGSIPFLLLVWKRWETIERAKWFGRTRATVQDWMSLRGCAGQARSERRIRRRRVSRSALEKAAPSVVLEPYLPQYIRHFRLVSLSFSSLHRPVIVHSAASHLAKVTLLQLNSRNSRQYPPKKKVICKLFCLQKHHHGYQSIGGTSPSYAGFAPFRHQRQSLLRWR